MGSSPVPIPRETGGPNSGKTTGTAGPSPSILVIEGMLLAEIPKMLLLLLSQGGEQLALAPAPAFAHSKNVNAAHLQKTRFPPGSCLVNSHTRDRKQVARKQSRFTSYLYDRR